MRFKVFFAGFLALILFLKGYLMLNGFGSLDGVWQLSSLWTTKTTALIANQYTQSSPDPYFTITCLLSPLLKMLGTKPVNTFYLVIYLLNALLLYQTIKPKAHFELLTYLVIIVCVFFNQMRIEDLSITLLLVGFLTIKKWPRFSFGIYCFWMIILPLIHPVTGFISILLYLYVSRNESRKIVRITPLICGVIVWCIITYVHYEIYVEQFQYRYDSNRFQLFLHIIPYLIALVILPLTRKFNTKQILILLGVFGMIIFFGKPYYFNNLVVFAIYMYSENLANTSPSGVKSVAIVVTSFLAFLVFPINQLIQRLENPSAVKVENQIINLVNTYPFPIEGCKFVEPGLSQTLLHNSQVRFYLFEANQNKIRTNQDIMPGDQMVITSKSALLNVLDGDNKNQIVSIDTVVSTNTGYLLLSKFYLLREEGTNLWVVNF